jgi:predicted ATPase/DNA-binding winged helix-turn-helix (wHTH) protein
METFVVAKADDLDIARKEGFEFGPFRFLPQQRMLLKNGVSVDVGSRALEILNLLLENAGQVLSKDELMSAVWPGVFVEESNLRVHISALRKAIGDGVEGSRYIINSPNRGYKFASSVLRHLTDNIPKDMASGGLSPIHNIPLSLSRIVGRRSAISFLSSQLEERRLVTLVGPGGIGKTTVAQAAALEMLPYFEGNACFVDLASLFDENEVSTRLSNSLGVRLGKDQSAPPFLAYLRGRRMLLVLDNCEHVISRVAELVEVILHNSPKVSVLATSREPLRADGEYVVPLRPLEFPATGSRLSITEILAYPAIELFVERAAARIDSSSLSKVDAAALTEICLKLDGIPLAIELAAARVGQFGIAGLASNLDDLFALLAQGRRTALPRHQTLRATLDWSYDLLSTSEKTILQRLAIFNGSFTPMAADAVVSDTLIEKSEVATGVGNLAQKSLVTLETGKPQAHYRLLETTRAYANEKLSESGQRQQLALQHAEYYRSLLQQSEIDWQVIPTAEWMNLYGSQMDNITTALNWAFSADGDLSVATRLTASTAPLWLQFSLISECRNWVERAMLSLATMPSDTRQLRMKLYAALGWSEMYATESGLQTGTGAWKIVLSLAEELKDTDYTLRALWALWADRVNHGECREALALAKRFSEVAKQSIEPADAFVGVRITGAALHLLGDQVSARDYIENMFKNYTTPTQRSHVVRYQFDQRITARITLSRVLWLQGYTDQAMAQINVAIDDAVGLNHVFSLCNTLAQAACPVALLAGNQKAAERFEMMLRSYTTAHSLDVWLSYADCFRGEILIANGQFQAGLSMMQEAIDKLRKANFVQYITYFLGSMAEGLIQTKQFAEALSVVEEALSRCEVTGEKWCYANLLRIKANVLVQSEPSANVKLAKVLYMHSLQYAGEHGCPAWELRTAVDLARLLRDLGSIEEAVQILETAMSKFVEGSGSVDFVSAKKLSLELKGTLHA